MSGVNQAALPSGRLVRVLTALGENTYLSAIRAGMVAVVPLTIIGGLFMIAAHLPVSGWDSRVAPYRELLQIPVTATFGLLAVVACFSIAYDLGQRLKQDAMASASMATVTFLLIQLDVTGTTLVMENLGSKGLFTAILVALVTVHVQKFFTLRELVIRMPASVPPIVSQSFVSLNPLAFLLVIFWLVRFVAGVDINEVVQTAFKPLVFALNTLPGILVYACLVTVLWSVGINGDNAVDAIVAPIFLQYLSANVAAMTQRTAVAVCDGVRFLHDVRQRWRDWRHDRARAAPRPIAGSCLPEDQPDVASDAGVPDQRADLLRPADRAEPHLHDSLRAERARPDDWQLPAHAVGIDSQAVRQRALDHTANHRALSGIWWRLARRRLGGGVDRYCTAGVFSVCQGRRAAAPAASARLMKA